jgi:hypothetical protein
MALSKLEKKKLCSGCRANRYNMGVGYQESKIDAPVTCDECWSLSSATLCNKLIYYSPNDYKPTKKYRTLSCWHNDMGHGEIVK